jgi:nucleoside 2-deoxyribosyltransferase
MPFEAKYDDVFFFAMNHAAERNDTICLRVDRVEYSGDIVSEIHRLIRSCVAMIADLSESRPNVLYETGYAHALGIPTIHICSTPLDELPFDVAQWNTLSYQPGQIHLLRKPLTKRLKAVL